MYTGQVTFNILDQEIGRIKQSDAINQVLGGWRQNGQILGKQFPLAITAQNYLCYVNIAEENSLSGQNDNHYIQKWLGELAAVGLSQPEILILGTEPEAAPLCSCDQSKSYILYTTFLSVEAPLRCGDCFGIVPLYKIPPTYDRSEYYDVIRWQSDYQNVDHLQMNCQVEEAAMVGLLFNLKSDLNQQGLKVCQTITKVTQKPVYYYLMQAKEVKTGQLEQERKCPSCGEPWLLKKPWHEVFDFKCECCHLLSNIAWTITES